MNILDSIMSAGNGATVRQLGSQLALDETQTATALSALVPALSAGLRQNAIAGSAQWSRQRARCRIAPTIHR
jgi:hypothetical protein